MGWLNRTPTIGKKKGLELNLFTLTSLTFMTLVLLQAFGLIIGDPLGISVKLGPVFILMSVSIASIISLALFKKIWYNQPVMKQDIFAVIVVVLIAVVMLFFLRDFVPEVFEQSIIQLQSLLQV